MRRLSLILAALAWLASGLVPTAADAAGPWTTITSVYQSSPDPVSLGEADATAASAAPSAARKPAPGPTEESRHYNLYPRRIHWHRGPRVEYQILNPPFARAVDAIERSERTVDQYITTRNFHHDNRAASLNPCTGLKNTVKWARLDRAGGLVASTTICVNLENREIGGFDMVLDSDDGWSIGPDGDPATYDVQNVATHEFGHVAGLDHVARRRDACLTMYLATSPEETEQRTLGWGDKRGLNVLYDTDDTSPGPGCGR